MINLFEKEAKGSIVKWYRYIPPPGESIQVQGEPQTVLHIDGKEVSEAERRQWSAVNTMNK